MLRNQWEVNSNRVLLNRAGRCYNLSQKGRRNMSDEFIGEAVTPVAGTFETAAMTRGEPALPARFSWRGQQYSTAEVLEVWKETGPCRSGGGEQYLRKHWYRIRTGDGLVMTIYFERQPRSKSRNKTRWWLYAVERSDDERQ